jgi:hypothetical protein
MLSVQGYFKNLDTQNKRGKLEKLWILSKLNQKEGTWIPGNSTQNYWMSGLCPSSEILNNREHNISEIGSVSVFR